MISLSYFFICITSVYLLTCVFKISIKINRANYFCQKFVNILYSYNIMFDLLDFYQDWFSLLVQYQAQATRLLSKLIFFDCQKLIEPPTHVLTTGSLISPMSSFSFINLMHIRITLKSLFCKNIYAYYHIPLDYEYNNHRQLLKGTGDLLVPITVWRI